MFQQTEKEIKKPITKPMIEAKNSVLIFIPFFPIKIKLIIKFITTIKIIQHSHKKNNAAKCVPTTNRTWI